MLMDQQYSKRTAEWHLSAENGMQEEHANLRQLCFILEFEWAQAAWIIKWLVNLPITFISFGGYCLELGSVNTMKLTIVDFIGRLGADLTSAFPKTIFSHTNIAGGKLELFEGGITTELRLYFCHQIFPCSLIQLFYKQEKEKPK